MKIDVLPVILLLLPVCILNWTNGKSEKVILLPREAHGQAIHYQSKAQSKGAIIVLDICILRDTDKDLIPHLKNPSYVSQHADDKRCRCVCPSPDAVLNGATNSKPQLFIAAVPPNQCTCDGVVLPTIKLPDHEQLFCLRCECKYESRSPPLIKFVVIMLVVIISFLTGYMVFLTWLRKFLARRKHRFYVENGAREAQNLIHEEDSED